MKSGIATLLGAALLCSTLAVQAQTTPQRYQAAREACKDKPDRRACMAEQVCAKAPDPARCQAESKQRMAQHMERRQIMHEACNGRRGDELMKCLGDQRKQQRGPKS